MSSFIWTALNEDQSICLQTCHSLQVLSSSLSTEMLQRWRSHTHKPSHSLLWDTLCSTFVKCRDAFVCVVQVCRRLQSAAGQLSSEGETGLWKTAQDHPPGRGSKVSLHTRSSLNRWSVLYISFLKTFFCTDKFYMNSVQHQTKLSQSVYVKKYNNLLFQFTIYSLGFEPV